MLQANNKMTRPVVYMCNEDNEKMLKSMTKKLKGGTNHQVNFVVQRIPQRSELLNYKYVTKYRFCSNQSWLIWMMPGSEFAYQHRKQ